MSSLLKPKVVTVLSLPRSGSSWVADILTEAIRGVYINEPFNNNHVKATERYHVTYLKRGEADADFCRRLVDPIKPGLRGLTSLFSARWVLVKEVHALLALEEFDRLAGSRMVLLLRHPCGMASSWWRLGWHPAPERWLGRLLNQPEVIKTFLSETADHIANQDEFWSRMGALWGAVNHAMMAIAERHPAWVIATHEQICANPIAEFRRINKALGTPWSKGMENKIEATNRASEVGDPYSIQRRIAEEPNKWRQELTGEQIAAVKNGARPFTSLRWFYPDIWE